MADTGIDVTGLDSVRFGKEMKEKEFCLRSDHVYLNHGAYGAVPRRILELQKKYLEKVEREPDYFYWAKVNEGWVEARQTVADFVGADVEDLMLVVNANQGVNTVLRSLKLKPGDAILSSTLLYSSFEKLWHDVPENFHSGVQALFLDIQMPIKSEDDIVQRYEDFLIRHPHIKFVLLDHITSSTSILMPIQRLASLCHKYGAMVLVDGAHAPGQVRLNLRELKDVDFYVGNLYKWLYTPRACALLWVKRENHRLVSPPCTSVVRGEPLASQFREQGTRDFVPFFCIKACLGFYQAIGGIDVVTSYTKQLATKGRDLLIRELGSLGLKPLAVPSYMEAPNMRLVVFPGVPASLVGKENMHASIAEFRAQKFEEDKVSAQFSWFGSRFVLRLGVNVYSTLEDFHKMVPVLRRLMESCVAR